MTTLALYAASAALLVASPATAAAPEEAQAVPIPAEDAAVLQEGMEARTASAPLPERADDAQRARLHDDSVAPEDARPAPQVDPGFKRGSDAARFQQDVWTGP